MTNLPDAEDLNYWKSSGAAAETWMDKAVKLLVDYGGEIVRRAHGEERGREAYMLEFRFGDESFRVIWPVLPSRGGEPVAARRQAATMLYHDIKSRAVRFKIFGPRLAFFEFLLLPGGKTAGAAALPELVSSIPSLLLPEGGRS